MSHVGNSVRSRKLLAKYLVCLLVLLFSGMLSASQDIPIFFNYPSFKGDFYVSGRVPFSPGAVKSKENIIVRSHKPEEEVPTKIEILRKWADGSVLSAEIIFVANVSGKWNYTLSCGDEIQRRKIFTETAVLPTISFSVGGAPKIFERVDIDVGAINVRIDKSHDIYYYWHIIPILILIALLYYRSKRTKKIQ